MSQKYATGYGHLHRYGCASLFLLIFPALCVGFSIDETKEMFRDKSCIEGTLVASPGGLILVPTTAAQHTSTLSSWTEGIQDFAAMLPKLGMNYFRNTSPGSQPHQTVPSALDQSSRSLVNEIAQRNGIEYKYYLVNEEGAESQKHFTVALKLGDEEYVAGGPSIKKAQRAAATKAFSHTSYSKPPVPAKSSPLVSSAMNLPTLAAQLGKKLFNAGHETSQVNDKQQALDDDLDRDPSDTRHMYMAEYNQMNGHDVPSDECQLGNEYARMIDRNLGKSPVALVYEIAAKKKIGVVFELISEEGPAHAKTFGTRCSFGHLVADGLEKSKKKSKNEAAKKMLLLLRMLPDACMDDSLLQRTRKRKNKKKKKKNRRLEKLTGGDSRISGLNVGSSLNQFQRTLQSMNSMFSSLGQSSISNVGSGSLKKLAQRSASEFLGNASPQPIKPAAKSSSDGIKLPQLKSAQDQMEMPLAQDHVDNPFKPDFLNDIGGPPGQLNDQLKVNMETYQMLAKNLLNSDIERAASSLLRNTNTNNLQHQRQMPESATRSFKEELLYMMDLIDLDVEFFDIPTADANKLVSLVSVPTNPGRVCIGEGPNREMSQEKAAAEALFDLSEQGLDNIISRTD